MNQELANGAQNWDNRVSITPSGFFGSSTEMIQARENFMTKEELDFLLNSAKSIFSSFSKISWFTSNFSTDFLDVL